MTEKQEKIIHTALELFANQGVRETTTGQIARQAQVSEGLIYRHFDSKSGLLEAIVSLGIQRFGEVYAPIISETNPYEVIHKAIDIPFSIPLSYHNFWRLLFKLKWENDSLSNGLMNHLEPFLEKVSWALEKKGYPHPEEEAQFLSHLIESITMAILRDGTQFSETYIQLLHDKYR